MTLATAQRLVREAGYTNSAADWEDDEHVYAFSRECDGPETFGHPSFTVHFRKPANYATCMECEGVDGHHYLCASRI